MKARTLAAVTLAASEPAAALAHRAVMHGSGWRWHRSHHRPRRGGWEDNDRFPVLFAALTMGAMAFGRGIGRCPPSHRAGDGGGCGASAIPSRA